MTRRRDFVSPARAAKMLGVHRNTVYSWAKDSVDGVSSRFRHVDRNPLTGYLEIPIEEVERAKESGDDD